MRLAVHQPAYLEALDIFTALDGEGRLSPDQKGWIDIVNGELAALPDASAAGATAE